MSFANLSLSMVLLGLVVVAAALFVLQILRARHRTIVLPTTVFWQQAVQESPVRVFTKKFRHILAYLLSLLIAALLWLGFAEPDTDNQQVQGYTILYLDGSAGMSRADAFVSAKAALQNDLAGLPINSREVVFGGAYTDTLLTAGEESVLFDSRARDLTPQAAPSALAESLSLLAQRHHDKQAVEIRIYGQAKISQSQLSVLPANTSVTQAYTPKTLSNNQGIVALGYGYAASGQPDVVDVLVSVAGTGDIPASFSALSFKLGEQTFVTNTYETQAQGQYILRNVPANGAVFTARLTAADELAIDNQAKLRLPNMPVIKVAVSDSVPAAIQQVIALDPGLSVSNAGEQADIAIRLQGESLGSSLPALVLDPAQAKAFEVAYTGQQSAELALHQAMYSLGLNQIDTATLAEQAQLVIGLDVQVAEQKSVSVWPKLFSEEYNFVTSQAFPLFVTKSLRWLGGAAPLFPHITAGEPIVMQQAGYSLITDNDSVSFDLNTKTHAVLAGQTSLAEQDLEVALGDVSLSQGKADAELTSAPSLDVMVAMSDWLMWLAAALCFLLIAEWFAFLRGLIP